MHRLGLDRSGGRDASACKFAIDPLRTTFLASAASVYLVSWPALFTHLRLFRHSLACVQRRAVRRTEVSASSAACSVASLKTRRALPSLS